MGALSSTGIQGQDDRLGESDRNVIHGLRTRDPLKTRMAAPSVETRSEPTSTVRGRPRLARGRYLPAVVLLLLMSFSVLAHLGALDQDLPLPDGDETFFVKPAVSIAATGNLNPHWFGHPGSTVIYPVAVLVRVWDAASGGPILGSHAALEQRLAEDPRPFYVIARLWTIALAVATIPVLFALGRHRVQSANRSHGRDVVDSSSGRDSPWADRAHRERGDLLRPRHAVLLRTRLAAAAASLVVARGAEFGPRNFIALQHGLAGALCHRRRGTTRAKQPPARGQSGGNGDRGGNGRLPADESVRLAQPELPRSTTSMRQRTTHTGWLLGSPTSETRCGTSRRPSRPCSRGRSMSGRSSD